MHVYAFGLKSLHYGPELSRKDGYTGPLARPFAHSLALLTHFLAPHCSLCLCAPLRCAHMFPCSLTHSRAGGCSSFLFCTIVHCSSALFRLVLFWPSCPSLVISCWDCQRGGTALRVKSTLPRKSTPSHTPLYPPFIFMFFRFILHPYFPVHPLLGYRADWGSRPPASRHPTSNNYKQIGCDGTWTLIEREKSLDGQVMLGAQLKNGNGLIFSL